MENYIVINGKKAELTPEQLKALGIKMESPFEFDTNQEYYFITSIGTVADGSKVNAPERHSVANYCTDPDLMKQRALHETLNRLLWRYSMEHKGDKIGWCSPNSNATRKHTIYYDHSEEKWCIECWIHSQSCGAIYFYDKETAQNAIEDIVKPFMAEHPEFKW